MVQKQGYQKAGATAVIGSPNDDGTYRTMTFINGGDGTYTVRYNTNNTLTNADSTVYLKGLLSEDEMTSFKKTSDPDILVLEKEIPSGMYEFAIFDSSSKKEYGNSVSFSDSIYRSAVKNEGEKCTFVASGGTYEFKYELSTKKLSVYFAQEEIEIDSDVYGDTDSTLHKWSKPTFVWEGTDIATAVFTCANESDHIVTLNAEITSDKTAPQCESDGIIVYTAKVVFENNTYTDTKTETLPKTGHDYGDPEWTWNGYQTVYATFICKNGDSHYENVNASITSKKTEPTCESYGKIVYSAAVTFEGKTYTDKKTKTIKKTGHSYKVTSWDWVDFDKATVTFTCEHDKSHTQTIDAEITSEITDDGYTIYTATAEFDGKKYTDSKMKPLLGLRGDVDGDGAITANDALAILRSSVGMANLTPVQNKLADVDGDGQITANDALAVLRYSVGMADEDSPINKPIAA